MALCSFGKRYLGRYFLISAVAQFVQFISRRVWLALSTEEGAENQHLEDGGVTSTTPSRWLQSSSKQARGWVSVAAAPLFFVSAVPALGLLTLCRFRGTTASVDAI